MSVIRPLGDGVLVRRVEEETKTAGGILLPGSAAEKPSQGIVVAVGKGKVVDGQLRPVEVKVGEKVVFGTYAGTAVKVGKEEFLMLREDDILGVFES